MYINTSVMDKYFDDLDDKHKPSSKDPLKRSPNPVGNNIKNIAIIFCVRRHFHWGLI